LKLERVARTKFDIYVFIVIIHHTGACCSHSDLLTSFIFVIPQELSHIQLALNLYYCVDSHVCSSSDNHFRNSKIAKCCDLHFKLFLKQFWHFCRSRQEHIKTWVSEWLLQFFSYVMSRTIFNCWDDDEVRFVLDQHSSCLISGEATNTNFILH
jgi:hypothetical protein